MLKQWQQRLSLLVFLLVIIVFSYTVIQIISNWQHRLTQSSNQSVAITVENKMTQAITHLPDAHLFGMAIAKGAVLPITNLPIQLTGIIKNQIEQQSRALISENNEPSKIYQAGDRLASGARLSAITDEGIILENGAQLERLPLRTASTEES